MNVHEVNMYKIHANFLEEGIYISLHISKLHHNIALPLIVFLTSHRKHAIPND